MQIWELRSFSNEDWITFLYFFNLLILVGMHQSQKRQFQKFVRFFQLEYYFANYGVESSLKLFQPFYIGSFLLLLSGYGLWAYSILEAFNFNPNPDHFYYGVGIVGFLFVIRFVFIRLLLPFFKDKDLISHALYRSFTYNTAIAIIALAFLLLYRFWLRDPIMLWTISYVLIAVWLILQVIAIRFFLRFRAASFFYLIFYLCTFRIGPWLWLYEILLTGSL